MALPARSIVPVWIAAALGAIAVAGFASAAFLVWLPVVMAAAVLLTFTIQLGLARKEGFVERIIASLGGAFGILVLASGLIWLGSVLTAGGVPSQ
ncbi:MAG: hypothetical protein QM675_01305 [Protaetiibacter sp.]